LLKELKTRNFGKYFVSIDTLPPTILPHNFNEVIKAQIAFLKNRPFKLLPDFFNGGLLDAGQYEDGNGKVRVRARIEITDEKIFIPFSSTFV